MMNGTFSQAGYQPVPDAEAAGASRTWWDEQASEYLAEHGDFLGNADLIWGPEGISEDDVSHLGEVAGLRVLEVGCGAGQGARWATRNGAEVIGMDLSLGMLRAAQELHTETGLHPGLVQADALALPLASNAFDLAFSAYGAIPFVPDLEQLHREVARVLKPGGRWVFATSHPIRWAFPDVPNEAGLTANKSYFDRTPYSERDESGSVTYVEYHRTMGDHIAALRSANLQIEELIEPEWPESNQEVWGGWSPLRGRFIPGTIIFVVTKMHTD